LSFILFSVTVDPQKSIDYVQRNRNKKVIYRSFVTNSYTNIGVNGSFNALERTYSIENTFYTNIGVNGSFNALALQVSIGGQNVLNSTLSMTYENFLEQVNLAEQLTSSDFGVSTGLISAGYWEQSKWYFVNVERGNIADKLQPRNIDVSFNNNSNVPIDVIIFIFYSDQLTIDVETGMVTE
jgi:hypothetical protein